MTCTCTGWYPLRDRDGNEMHDPLHCKLTIRLAETTQPPSDAKLVEAWLYQAFLCGLDAGHAGKDWRSAWEKWVQLVPFEALTQESYERGFRDGEGEGPSLNDIDGIRRDAYAEGRRDAENDPTVERW